MSAHVPDSETTALARRIAAILSKDQQGLALDEDDREILLVAAFRYLEEHGQDIPAEQLPALPSHLNKALGSIRERAVERALRELGGNDTSSRGR
jgi:hypothetical protein